MKRIFCLLFVLFICRISCETLYIANNGTGAACSKESPCTVSEINTHIINPGDVLQFGCGVFEGLNVSNATIRGDDSGCTVFTTSSSTYCMQIDGVTTVAGIKFTNCTNSFGATNQLNLILANSTFTSSPIKLSGNLIRIEMQNVSSDKEIVLVNQNYTSLYFYIFSTKASFVNITSLTNITKGSTISNLQVGKSATSDPLSITSNYIGEANHPVAIKNLKVIKAITNGLRIRAEYVANVMLINSYIQSAGSRSISAIANQGQLIFSIRNTQFYSSGSFDFISNSAAINKTTLAVKIDTSSFSYINTNTSLLNLQGTSVEFKTCSSSYTNNLLPSTVISIEDSTTNSNSALKGFISNSVFSNNAGNYVTFAKSSIDSKFLICGNTFVGGPSAKRALLVTSSKYRAAQNNNFFDDNFSNSVIEVVSSSVQLNFTTTIFNGTSPNFVTSTKDGSVIELNFDNSLINPRTYVATNCLNVNSSVSTVSLTNTTFRNCDSIVLNSGSSNFTMQGNSSIYTVGYYQTNFKCLNAASISFLTVAKNNTQTCFNQLKPNNCLNANVTTASCSETTFTSRFNSSFIQPCQKGPCACYWQGDCSCNVTTPPAITVQTVAYCSQGTYYIYDPYPIFLPTATYSLQDSLSFTGPVWIKNTTKFVLTYNGTYYPTISSEDFVNVTGSLTLNITARPPDVDSKNKKKTLLVIKSNKKLNGTLLTITAPNNYTISGKCDKTSVKPVYGNNQVSLNLTLSLNTSCSDIMSDGAVAGIMIAIIIAIIFGVFISHKLENWNKK